MLVAAHCTDHLQEHWPQQTCLILSMQEVMGDPVIAADGHTYERDAIESWLQAHGTSLQTGLPLPHYRLTRNQLIKSAIARLYPERRVD